MNALRKQSGNQTKSSASQPARKKPGPAKGTPRKRREPDDIEAQAQRDTWT